MSMTTKGLFMALGAAALFAGCGSDAANSFEGDYAGVGRDDNYFYALEANVAADGAISGSLYVYDGTVSPLATDFPGSDYGDVLDLTGQADDADVTATAGDFTISGSFDATTGIFQGTIEEDGAEATDMNLIAAHPVLPADEISVACGDYYFNTVASASADPRFVAEYTGDVAFVTTGTDTFGILVSSDGSLTGTFLGALGTEDLCAAGGYCYNFDGDVTGDWDGDPVEFTVDGTGEQETYADYTYFVVGANLDNDDYSGSIEADTDYCYSWDWTP